jgi:4-hydroxy-4-methyl-2-oxoglutarate aldolase
VTTESGAEAGAGLVHDSPPPVDPATIACLQRVGLATASSSLPPLVLRARVLDGHALHRISGHGAVAGTVVTAWNVWGSSPLNPVLFQMLRPGDVLVVAGDTTRALWGDLATQRARNRSVRAAIVDGSVRDVDAIRESGLSVWAKRIFVGDGPRNGAPGAINVPVTVDGAVVEPGDVVLADGDGIGFLPRAMVDAIAVAADARDAHDRAVLEQLRAERPNREP